MGINADSNDSHQRFAEKLALPFALLSDPDRTVCSLYGTLKSDGKGVLRTVIVVSPAGRIAYRELGSPDPSTILSAIKENRS